MLNVMLIGVLVLGFFIATKWNDFKWKREFKAWLLSGENTPQENEEILKEFVKKIQRGVDFGIFDIPQGRAAAFIQEFADEINLETDVCGFTPRRSKDKVELKEYGFLCTEDYFIIKYQTNEVKEKTGLLERNKPKQYNFLSFLFNFDGLWRVERTESMLYLRYPEETVNISLSSCDSISDEIIIALEFLIQSGYTRDLYLNSCVENEKTTGFNDLDASIQEAYEKNRLKEILVSKAGNKVMPDVATGYMAGQFSANFSDASRFENQMKDIQLNAITKERTFRLNDNEGGIRSEIRRSGHGEAAEYANNVFDKLKFKSVESVGTGFSNQDLRGQGVNAVDRISNGVKIQSKYCKTPETTIKSFLNGNYPSDVALEVPKDQYQQVKETLKKTHSEIKVVKGNVTYKYAENVCKAGTIPSLTTDALAGVQAAIPGASISFIMVFAEATWNGMSFKEASKVSGKAAAKTLAIGTAVYAGGQQFSKTKLSKQIGKKIGKDSVAMAKYSGIAITGAMIYGPSVVDAIRGRISIEQLAKNVGTGTASVIGGAIGSVAGAPGAIAGGAIGAKIGKKIFDNMIEDDSIEMYEMVREEFIDRVLTAGLSEAEFTTMINLTFANKKFSNLLKDAFQAGRKFTGMEKINTQRKYIQEEIIDKNIIILYSRRKEVDITKINKALKLYEDNQLDYLLGA